MSDHAIGILVGALLLALILSLIGLHRKEREGRRLQAEMDRLLQNSRKPNPNAWEGVPQRREKK